MKCRANYVGQEKERNGRKVKQTRKEERLRKWRRLGKLDIAFGQALRGTSVIESWRGGSRNSHSLQVSELGSGLDLEEGNRKTLQAHQHRLVQQRAY